jgi:hypothetical protein
MALVPLQPPLAVHAVACVADQVRVLAPPFATLLGLADKLTVGTGWDTDTMTVCEALVPLEPLQVRV